MSGAPGPPLRLAWGHRGAREAAARGDVLVVVDVLSFSSAVATAVARGAIIHLAAHPGAEEAVHRDEVPGRGRFSLSPPTFLAAEPGERIFLRSPNGAACCGLGRDAPHLIVGSLVNAGAAAEAAARTALAVTVLACGERRPDGSFRVALEDYLGAGAILARMPGAPSREASTCAVAFEGARPRLDRLLRECASGRELRERGYAGDVAYAAGLNVHETAPFLRSGALLAQDSP